MEYDYLKGLAKHDWQHKKDCLRLIDDEVLTELFFELLTYNTYFDLIQLIILLMKAYAGSTELKRNDLK